MTSHNSSIIGLPISSLTSFPAAFSQSSSDPPSQGPNLPSDTPGTLFPQGLHICWCLNGTSAGLPSSLPSDLYLCYFSTLRPSLATFVKISTSLSPQVLLTPLSYLMFFFVLIIVKHATVFTLSSLLSASLLECMFPNRRIISISFVQCYILNA